MHKILIAINDNLSALNAAKYGIALAQRVNAQIGIIEVTNYSVGAVEAGIMPADFEKAGVLHSKAHINQIKKAYPNLHIDEFEPIGIPDKELNTAIKLWGADLLVIGHQVHDLLHSLLLRSVEKELLKHIIIPVLIVPEHYEMKP